MAYVCGFACSQVSATTWGWSRWGRCPHRSSSRTRSPSSFRAARFWGGRRVVEARSLSRLGDSDLGVNARRLETLHRALIETGAVMG